MTQVNATDVGWLFVQQYYTFLNATPELLHGFYSSASVSVHGCEGDDTAPHATGPQVPSANAGSSI